REAVLRAALPAAPAPDPAGGDLEDVLAVRVADLTGYQNAAHARSYAEEVRHVAALAAQQAGEEAGTRVGLAYARGLHKLMAYKDEYEVARLHLDPAERARREREFGSDAVVSVLLHPPLLRAMGVRRKIRIRRGAGALFRGLRAARVLRGTVLDVFGYARVRRVERALVGEYRDLVRRALDRLIPDTADDVEAIAALPEMVRGYEDIKLARVAEFRDRAATALARLDREPAPRSGR
uniref:DUF6537 domain-containing protein n=1 Tax=Nonomuraea lactucae TaxID=2249762 RepID=UPI0030845B2F